MNGRAADTGWLANTVHSIWLRVLGFALGFLAAGLVVAGLIVGGVGLFGGILVRIRPDTTANINYDPSTVVLLAPLPILAGLAIGALSLWIGRRLGPNR